jgi:hypothetical protein
MNPLLRGFLRGLKSVPRGEEVNVPALVRVVMPNDKPIEFVSASEISRRCGLPLPTLLNRLRRKSIVPDGQLVCSGITKAPPLLFLAARVDSIINEIRN